MNWRRPKSNRAAAKFRRRTRGGGLFAWLFGARGGGEDDAEESSGQETLVGARGPRGEQRFQIAAAGPEAVANAKEDLPTGPTYASAPPAAPAASPQAAPAPRIAAGRQRQLAGQAQRADRGAVPRAPPAAAAERS